MGKKVLILYVINVHVPDSETCSMYIYREKYIAKIAIIMPIY